MIRVGAEAEQAMLERARAFAVVRGMTALTSSGELTDRHAFVAGRVRDLLARAIVRRKG